MRTRRPAGGLQAVAAAATLGLLLAGCSQGAELTSTSAGQAQRPTAGAGRPPSAPPSQTSPAAETSLPPGDPGLDAPSVPDPGTAGVAQPPAEPKEPRTIPGQALLSPADLHMTYGGRWQQRRGREDECVATEGALAERTRSFRGPGAGRLVQTVAAYGDVRRADAAVLDLRTAAERCGWTDVHDPRIGSAAVTADDGQGRSLTAVSADGALVVLVGSGRVTAGWKWDALVDLALGSSCPAAVDGCH